MKHALIEDDEPVRFHINPVEQLSIFIPIVDVGILSHGKFLAEEDPVDEFRIASLRSDRRDGKPLPLCECFEFSLHSDRRAREIAGTMPIQDDSPLHMTSGFKYTIAWDPLVDVRPPLPAVELVITVQMAETITG